MKLAPTKISGEDCRRRFQEKFTGKLWKKFVKGELQTGLVDGQNKDRETCRHRETWWWNDDVYSSVTENRVFWTEWKQTDNCRDKNNEKYLGVKRKTRKSVYQAKCEVDR